MLRNLFVIGLICGFLYVISDLRSDFTELRYQRVSQIENALNQ